MLSISNLVQAEEGCRVHIADLVDEADHLHQKSKFKRSIFLSIIAMEEIGKYATYCNYLLKKIEMPNNIEEKLRTNHIFKLRQPVILDHERSKSYPKDKTKIYTPFSNFERLLEKQKNFNKIKKLCLYYDFIKNKEVNIQNYYSDKINKNDLLHFSFVISYHAFYHNNFEFLRYKYGNTQGVIYVNKIDKQDPVYLKLLEIDKEMGKEKYSIKTYNRVFSELVKFHDALYPE